MDFEKELKAFPSTFDIYQDVTLLPGNYLSTRRGKLLRDLDWKPLDTDMEKCRIWNLISFLYYVLHDVQSALTYNGKTLELCKNNIIALSNKANIYYREKENFKVIKEVCEKINVLKQDKWLMVVARSEITYSLSKLGIKFYGRVREMYSNILEECKQVTGSETVNNSGVRETTLEERHPEETFKWMFEMALITNRMLNVHNTKEETKLTRQKYTDVWEMFVNIIQKQCSTPCSSINQLKARAYVELGLLAHNSDRNRLLFPNGHDQGDMLMSTDRYFDKALSLCPTDEFVLSRSGKYFRYAKQIEKSIFLLRESLKHGETSFAHHHLALSLKRRLQSPPNFQDLSPCKQSTQHVRMLTFPDHESGSNIRMREPEKQSNRNKDIDTRQSESYSIGPQDKKKVGLTNKIVMPNVSGLLTSFKEMRVDTNSFVEYTPDQSSRNSDQRSSNTDYDQTKDENRNTSGDSAENHQKFSFSQNFQGREIVRNNYQRSFSDTPERKDTRRSTNNMSNWQNIHKTRRGVSLDEKGSQFEPVLTNQQYALKIMIKSPKKEIQIDRKKEPGTVQEIFEHLERSFEMTGNPGALYDKGLFLRSLGEKNQALTVFKLMLKDTMELCSPLQLANAYEQAGLCLYDIITDDQEPDSHLHLLDDMKTYFRRSIEFSCDLVSKLPYFKDCWESIPTLRSLLLNPGPFYENRKEILKDHLYLCEKIGKYKEAVEFLTELRELAADEREEAEIMGKIVRQHMNDGKYEEAVLALRICFSLTQYASSMVDKSLYLKVLVKGGIHAIKSGQRPLGRSRLQFLLKRSAENVAMLDAPDESFDSDVEDKDEGFDIFILSDEDDESNGETLKAILRLITIKATVNTRDGVPGEMDMKIMQNFVTSSKHVLVVYGKISSNPKKFEMQFASVMEWKNGNIVVVKDKTVSEIPTIMAGCKTVDFNLAITVSESLLQDDTFCNEVEQLLLRVSE